MANVEVQIPGRNDWQSADMLEPHFYLGQVYYLVEMSDGSRQEIPAYGVRMPGATPSLWHGCLPLLGSFGPWLV